MLIQIYRLVYDYLLAANTMQHHSVDHYALIRMYPNRQPPYMCWTVRSRQTVESQLMIVDISLMSSFLLAPYSFTLFPVIHKQFQFQRQIERKIIIYKSRMNVRVELKSTHSNDVLREKNEFRNFEHVVWLLSVGRFLMTKKNVWLNSQLSLCCFLCLSIWLYQVATI